MKTEIKTENEMDIKTNQTIHPHNETLQLIDAKCARLIETIEYISSIKHKTDRKQTETSILECTNRINELGKTKGILLNENDIESFLLQGNFYE